jgi:hypothetical protein
LAIVVAAAAAATLLSVLGTLVNMFSLVRWRRPSQFGIRLRLTMAGLAMMLGAMVLVIFATTYTERSAPLWAVAASAFAFGAWVMVGGARVFVSEARPQEVAAAPATRQAASLLAIGLLPVLALAMWAVATLPSHLHTSVVAVSAAGTLSLFAVYVFTRATKMSLRLRLGGLSGSSLLLALAIFSLLNTILLMTLDLPG